MKIHLVKNKTGFYPADEKSQDLMKKIKFNETYSCDVKLEQNYGLHRKIFAFFSYCTDHYYGGVDEHKNPVQLSIVREVITIAAGHCDPTFDRNGKFFKFIPRSISYEKMPTEERQEFYARAVNAALNIVFDDSTDEHLINELLRWF
ncbi:MAG: hypothetical protein ACJAYB_000076 [Psychromonas sp.]|jgi:hypothetical protein